MATRAELQQAFLDVLKSDAGQAEIERAVALGARVYFLGSDGGAKTVEGAVAHVTQGYSYHDPSKGINYPKLAQAMLIASSASAEAPHTAAAEHIAEPFHTLVAPPAAHDIIAQHDQNGEQA